MSVKFFTSLVLASSLLAGAPVYAAGSGGGGGGGGGGNFGNGNISVPTYDPVVEYQSGLDKINAGDFKAADKHFSNVIKVAKTHAQSHYYRGVAKVGQGKHKSATKSFKSAIKYDENMHAAYGGLGAAYVNAGKTEKAQAVQQDLAALAASCGDCAQASAIKAAQDQITSALNGGTEKGAFLSPLHLEKTETQYFASVALINNGEYQAAFDDLTLTASVAGPHPDITTYQGYTQRKLGNYDVAKSYYALALAVDPNHKGANEYLGELYVETGEMDKAKAQLAKLEEICSFGCIEENELRKMVRRHSLKFPHLLSFTLTAFCLAACSGETSRPAADIPAPEITRWIQPGDDLVAALSEEPRECLPPASDKQTALGRLAFRSPFLLGGQAARRGLTCQACHGQGQVNSHFFVVGLSDSPGTADVTSFHFSDVLGDEVFNPVPIPSLSDDVEGVDFSADTKDLDVFVKRLITKEFTGPEPTPEVEAALLAYIRALDNTHCPSATVKGLENLNFKLEIISSSFEAISAQDLSKDSYDFMLAALRIELGRLHSRYPNHPKLRDRLIVMSADLNTVKVENPDLSKLAADWKILEPSLRQAYEGSLFDVGAIQTWLAAR